MQVIRGSDVLSSSRAYGDDYAGGTDLCLR